MENQVVEERKKKKITEYTELQKPRLDAIVIKLKATSKCISELTFELKSLEVKLFGFVLTQNNGFAKCQFQTFKNILLLLQNKLDDYCSCSVV